MRFSVVHQHVNARFAASIGQCLARQGQIALSVGIIQKAGQAIVATLDNVLGNSGQAESWLPGDCLWMGARLARR